METYDFNLGNNLPPEEREQYIKEYVARVFKVAYESDQEIKRLGNVLNSIYQNLCELIYLMENNKEYDNSKVYNFIYNNLFLKSESENIRKLSTEAILQIGEDVFKTRDKDKKL